MKWKRAASWTEVSSCEGEMTYHLCWRWKWCKRRRRLMNVGCYYASRWLPRCCHYGRRSTSCSSSRWYQIHSRWRSRTSCDTQLTIFLHINCRAVRWIETTACCRQHCFPCQAIHAQLLLPQLLLAAYRQQQTKVWQAATVLQRPTIYYKCSLVQYTHSGSTSNQSLHDRMTSP